MKNFLKRFGTPLKWLLLFVVLIIVLVRYGPENPKQDGRTKLVPAPSVGDTCFLYSENGPEYTVLKDARTYAKLTQLYEAGDTESFSQLLWSADVYWLEAQTRVRVVKVAHETSEIQILEGPHKGVRGVVVTNWLRKE